MNQKKEISPARAQRHVLTVVRGVLKKEPRVTPQEIVVGLLDKGFEAPLEEVIVLLHALEQRRIVELDANNNVLGVFDVSYPLDL